MQYHVDKIIFDKKKRLSEILATNRNEFILSKGYTEEARNTHA